MHAARSAAAAATPGELVDLAVLDRRQRELEGVPLYGQDLRGAQLPLGSNEVSGILQGHGLGAPGERGRVDLVGDEDDAQIGDQQLAGAGDGELVSEYVRAGRHSPLQRTHIKTEFPCYHMSKSDVIAHANARRDAHLAVRKWK